METDEELQTELQTMIERSFNLAGGDLEAYQEQIDIISVGTTSNSSPQISPEKGQNPWYSMNPSSIMPQIHSSNPNEKTFEHIELELQMERKEKKLESLYEELSTVERERTRLREVVLRYEDDTRVMAQQFEECKIENEQLKKHIEIYEEKVAQSANVREEKMQTHIQTIKELEREIEIRGQRIRDLTREKEANELKASEELATVQNELDMKKEQVTALQNTAAVIDVYKKKIQDMAQLQQDLEAYQERIQYLQDEVDLLKQERSNNKNLKECVAALQSQLDSAKDQRQSAVTQAARTETRMKQVVKEKSDIE